MKYLSIVSFLLLTYHINFAQTSPLKAFDNLVGGVWVSSFPESEEPRSQSKMQFEYGLNKQMIKLKTYNNVKDPKKFELHSEGIRVWDRKDSLIHFYEFDRKGSTYTGTVLIEGANIHYEYTYKNMQLRDSWIYKDKNTYEYTVGKWYKGRWEQIFFQHKFIRKRK